MAAETESLLIKPISVRQFELYALSLERGPNFEPATVFAAYQVGRGSGCGGILLDQESATFSTIAMRRRVDHCWTCVAQHGPFSTPEQALETLRVDMRGGDAPEPLPPGARRRPLLIEVGQRGSSPEFDLLIKSMSHLPALMAVGECYLALPRPDPNFVPDLQTNNFASRLFELYLLACFREQGLRVRQDHVSPDFQIEKDGATCWVEAVTANSETPRAGGIGDWVRAPTDRTERLGFLAGWRPPGLTMIRRGILFDRTPGALEPIDFELEVGSAEYDALWPWGEAWCQELEVYHNPLAAHPIPFDLISGATHWFEQDGDVECRTMWANSVISSITNIRAPKGYHPSRVERGGSARAESLV